MRRGWASPDRGPSGRRFHLRRPGPLSAEGGRGLAGGGRGRLLSRIGPVTFLLALVAGCTPSPGGDAEADRLLEGAGIGVRGVPVGTPAPRVSGAPDLRATVLFWPGDSLRAVRVARILAAAPDLPALRPGLPRGVHLALAPSEAHFDSLTGGAVPEWGAGVAVPSMDRIVLPVYPAPRTRGWDEARVVRHEWAHLGLFQAVPGLRIPRWFNEGYAEWASGAWNAEEGWRLRVALATGRLPPLDSLALSWPRDRASADLAYLLAASAVEFLVDRSGERGVEILLARWNREGSFESAVRGTYGLTGSQLEEAWRRFIRSRYGWLAVLSGSLFFWLLAGGLLGVLFLIRRRRDRAKLERLRREEPPDAPAWWLEGLEATDGAPGGSAGGGGGSPEEGEGGDPAKRVDPDSRPG